MKTEKQVLLSDVDVFYNSVQHIIGNCIDDIEISSKYVHDNYKIAEETEYKKALKGYLEIIEGIYNSAVNEPDDAMLPINNRGQMFAKSDFRFMISRANIDLQREQRKDDHLLSISFTHIVSLIDSAILDSLREVFILIPSILHESNREMKYSEIFKYKSLKELQSKIIDDKLLLLGHGSIKEQIKYIETFAKSPMASPKMLEIMSEIRATRNLIVHNRGMINKLYLQTVKTTEFKVNEYRTLNLDYFDSSTGNCISFIEEFGTKLILKLAPSTKASLLRQGLRRRKS